jgi:hypothetical protein
VDTVNIIKKVFSNILYFYVGLAVINSLRKEVNTTTYKTGDDDWFIYFFLALYLLLLLNFVSGRVF